MSLHEFDLKGAVDNLPLGMQLILYAIMGLLSLAGILGYVSLNRRSERRASPDTVLLNGFNASIADMKPVREVVAMMPELLDEAKKANVTLVRIEELLREELEEIEVERRVRRRLQDERGRRDR